MCIIGVYDIIVVKWFVCYVMQYFFLLDVFFKVYFRLDNYFYGCQYIGFSYIDFVGVDGVFDMGNCNLMICLGKVICVVNFIDECGFWFLVDCL